MRYALAIAAVMVTTPVSAGDYAVLNCNGTKIVMSYQEDGIFSRMDGKIIPRKQFVVKRHGSEVYYRGKRCIEIEDN